MMIALTASLKWEEEKEEDEEMSHWNSYKSAQVLALQFVNMICSISFS